MFTHYFNQIYVSIGFLESEWIELQSPEESELQNLYYKIVNMYVLGPIAHMRNYFLIFDKAHTFGVCFALKYHKIKKYNFFLFKIEEN